MSMSKDGTRPLAGQMGDSDDPYGLKTPQEQPMRKPENTAKHAQDDPMSVIAEAMLFGSSRAIERSERAGQEQLLKSDVLPTQTDGDEPFVVLGFRFGAPVDGDPLFREATLPSGWKREGSDHDMWSYIVDERGIRRIGVFYKAAFYDRRANMHIINVGNNLASAALYGDTPITPESLQLARLTADERRDVERTLDNMAAQIKDCPSVYGKYAERLKACRAAITAVSAAPGRADD